jgi:hypothetical protein
MRLMGIPLGGDKVFGVTLLLAERLGERCNPPDDTDCHEQERDNRPNDTPALRRASIFPSEDASVRGIHLAQNEIITL